MGNYHPSKTNVNLIWRNGVLCTNLHSGHLAISMIDSNTTEYIAEKNIFKLSSHWQFGNISSSFGFVLYSVQNWNVLVCLKMTWSWWFLFHVKNRRRASQESYDIQYGKGFWCFLEINFKIMVKRDYSWWILIRML